ncbi:MAG: class I SAM-dependent methyltransferase [Desulfobacteraceae bacterium]
MLSKIPPQVLEVYKPLSLWESLYLRMRWRLCPYELVESFLPDTGRILDFGCGYGMLANFSVLQSPKRSAFGIDLNLERIRIAERSSRNRQHITFTHGDIRNLKTAPFDAVVMTDVLHHINDTNVKVLLDKIRMCLVNTGILVVLDIDRRPFWKFFLAYLIDRLLNLDKPLYFRSVQKMRNLMKRSCLHIDKIVPADRGLPLSDIIYVCKKEV